MVVLHVLFEMLGKMIDPIGQNRDLNFRGSCVVLSARVLGNDFFLVFSCNRHRVLLKCWERMPRIKNAGHQDVVQLHRQNWRPYAQNRTVLPEDSAFSGFWWPKDPLTPFYSLKFVSQADLYRGDLSLH
jgi:hypothetical protein